MFSQGRVAMHCRCGGKYDTSLVANLLMSLTVKKCWKSVNIYQSYERISSGTFFMAHSVLLYECERAEMDVTCRRGGERDWVTWHRLHTLFEVLDDLEVQRYDTSATDRHQCRWLRVTTRHCGLPGDFTGVCRWLGVRLAGVGGWHRHPALASDRPLGHHQALDTVGKINSPSCDIAQRQAVDTVRCWWQRTVPRSAAELRCTKTCGGVTNRHIYCQLQQHRTRPGSGQRSQHWRGTAASVQRFTSSLAQSPWRRLSRKHILIRHLQSPYSVVQLEAGTPSRHRWWSSAELQAVAWSVLRGTNWTFVGSVRQRHCSVQCAKLLDLCVQGGAK